MLQKKGTDIRFIEMMPVGEGHTNGVEPYEKVIGALLEVYGNPCNIDTENREEINSGYNNADNGPAEYYSFHGLDIRVGLIQAIHGKFCDTCNRIRVTADGRLIPCLGSSVTMDLVPDSCEFTDDLEKDFVIVQALKAAIKAKPGGVTNFNDNAVTYTKNYRDKDCGDKGYRAESCGSKCSKKYEPDRRLIADHGKASCNQYKQRERN